MEVTRHNYNKVFSDVEFAVKNCDFMCIDGEFTGLTSGSNINPFDTPSECYIHYRDSCRDFLLIQFGLTTFHWNDVEKLYEYCTFIFYIFPRQEIKFATDKVFRCQSSSLDFLARHKFDFNKLFYDGISYIDTSEEVKLREYIEEKHSTDKIKKLNDGNMDKILIPENIQEKIDEMCMKVRDFLNKKEQDSLELNDLNAFQRRILYQELETRFRNQVFIKTKVLENDKRILVVYRDISEDEKIKMMEEEHDKEWIKVDMAVGFSTVARLMSDSGKLIVGHNFILDLMHIMNSFFYPLPEVYSEFKSLASHIFPSVLDTTYLAKGNAFKDLIASYDLKGLFNKITSEPFKIPKMRMINRKGLQGYNINDENYHNAGYDSFITGVCFLSMADYLKNNDNGNSDESGIDVQSPFLKPFLNKLFLFKTSFQGSPFINLSGKDPSPHRDHVFHLTFPKEWKRSNILEIFEPYGGLNTVAFKNETSAYVCLNQRAKSASVRQSLCKNNDNFKLIPYNEYKVQLYKTKFQDTIDISPKSSAVYEEDQHLNNIKEVSLVQCNSNEKSLKRKHEESENAKLGKKNMKGFTGIASSTEHISNNEKKGTKNRKEKKKHSTLKKNIASEEKRKNSDIKEKNNVRSNIFKESDNWD